jgi:hypothetical protein
MTVGEAREALRTLPDDAVLVHRVAQGFIVLRVIPGDTQPLYWSSRLGKGRLDYSGDGGPVKGVMLDWEFDV